MQVAKLGSSNKSKNQQEELTSRIVSLAPRPVEAGLKEIELSAQLRKFRSKCEACEAALVQANCAPMFVADDVESVSGLWLQALRLRPSMQHLSVTLSDVWFAMRCLLVCSSDLKFRPFQPVLQLQLLAYRLSVLASNHKARFLRSESEAERDEWRRFELDAGAYIVQHFSGGAVALRAELQRCQDAGLAAPKPEPELQRRWLELQMTVKSDDDAAVVADESLRGANFRNSLVFCARQFVARASAVLAQRHLETSLSNSLPKVEPFQPSEAQLSHLALWLESRCKATQNDTLARNFRDCLAELSLPAGARASYNRQKHSNCERPQAQTLCVQELGAEVAHEMQTEAMLVDFGQVAASPRLCAQAPLAGASGCGEAQVRSKHKYYDLVLLQLFDSYFFSTLRLRFVQNYVVWPGDLLEKDAQELAAAHVSDGWQRVQRSPKLFRLDNEWLVLSLGRWWPCRDVSHALLTWLHVAQAEHCGRSECHASLSSMLNKFLWLLEPLAPSASRTPALTA